jgi:hypothetical protein
MPLTKKQMKRLIAANDFAGSRKRALEALRRLWVNTEDTHELYRAISDLLEGELVPGQAIDPRLWREIELEAKKPHAAERIRKK